MDYLHVDYWTANSTALNVSIISPGPLETPYALIPSGQTGTWMSVDIPLSAFSPPVNLADVFQLKFDGNGDIYLDNIYFFSSATGIEEISDVNPSAYALEQNYPNPFNPSTAIRFIQPNANHVTLKVYDLLGQEIATLVNEFKNAGAYEVTFDASNLPSGIYLYSISTGDFNAVKKMMLIK
ncbi:MAG: T9SS type A sorting domain-containing protein [Calditrichaeota bacterium]|nr:T9SS type A sorting domain-containing protein [Calditrichota bacterium]